MDDIERTDVADRAEPTGLAETSELTELVPGETSLRIPVDDAVLDADLGVPEAARPGFGRTGTGLVVFAHGSGSSRLSPRNRYVARALREAGLATLLFDLLTPDEEEIDLATRTIRFDIGLLAERLVGVTDWLARMPATREMAIGYFGASTGAAAALVAAAERPERVEAIVSRGGRPDLAGPALRRVKAPTLLIVGSNDPLVLDLNRRAAREIPVPPRLEVVHGAGHLFEEPGALETVAALARDWFLRHLTTGV